jgi:hypothetical protein
MTSFVFEEFVCGVCGTKAEFTVLASSISFGDSADLDLRPNGLLEPAPLRLHQCRRCRYTAPNIEVADDGAREVVDSERYKQLTMNPEWGFARDYLLFALIAGKTGDQIGVALASQHASWTLEDRRPLVANRLRRKAVFHFKRIPGGILYDSIGLLEVVMADLLRRSGEFAKVPPVCQQGLSKSPGLQIRNALVAESQFSLDQDSNRHTWQETA